MRKLRLFGSNRGILKALRFVGSRGFEAEGKVPIAADRHGPMILDRLTFGVASVKFV